MLGVVGLLEDAGRVLTRLFPAAGLDVVLLGDAVPGPGGAGGLGGSEYLKRVHGLVRGRPAPVDFDREKALQRLVVDAARCGMVCSAHDCAEGGLAVALAECCIESGGIGARVDLPGQTGSNDGLGVVRALFGESPSRIIVSVSPVRRAELLALARSAGVLATAIGRTGGDRLTVSVAGDVVADVALKTAEHAWATGLTRHLDPAAVEGAKS